MLNLVSRKRPSLAVAAKESLKKSRKRAAPGTEGQNKGKRESLSPERPVKRTRKCQKEGGSEAPGI